MSDLSLTLLLDLYAKGMFPMAESRYAADIYIYDPEYRGILPLDQFHVSRSLRKTLRSTAYEVKVDTDFAQTIAKCAEAVSDREDTWINPEIERLYTRLFDAGYAHSVEVWSGANMVGGLYGVHLGGAFFGESMFSRETDTSKIALCHLAGRLIAGGFSLLDTQFVTAHLKRFGAREISRDAYQKRLKQALLIDGNFDVWGPTSEGDQVLQAISQTS